MKKNKNTRFMIVAICAAIFAFANTAWATPFTVNQAGDAGDGICDATCTLRDAVTAANAAASGDTINFAAGLTTITLVNTSITIANNGTLTINGLGANVLTIDGGAGQNRIFYINQNAVVTITDVTLTGGNGAGPEVDPNGRGFSGSGGAILVDRATLTLDRVHVTGNTATDGDQQGGGIYYYVSQNDVISNSTFSNNTAGRGGGFYKIFFGITITNSTFSGNTTQAEGGGFSSFGAGVTIRNTTITANSVTGGNGGGISTSGSIDIGSSILAGNTALAQPEISDGRADLFTSSGYNLIGDSPGDSTDTRNTLTYQMTDILDTNPQLGALQNNGGPTLTHALMNSMTAVSPAIDKGNRFGSTTDQRGFMRPVDILNIMNAADGADIGAFESQGPTAASVSVGGRVLTAMGRGIRNARVSLTDAHGDTRMAITNAFGFYRFTDITAGETYILTVRAKLYNFQTPTQVLSVTEDETEVNFTAY